MRLAWGALPSTPFLTRTPCRRQDHSPRFSGPGRYAFSNLAECEIGGSFRRLPASRLCVIRLLLPDRNPNVVVSRVNNFDHAHDLAVRGHLNVEVADKVNAQNGSAAAVCLDGCDLHGARPGRLAA